MGHYLQTHRSDSTGCLVVGCSREGRVELTAVCSDGTKYLLPACDNHIAQVHTAKREIESGKDPREVKVQITIKGKKTFANLSPSEVYCYPPNAPVIPKSKPEKQEKKHTASSQWRWIDDFDMWMNTDGKVVSLSTLDDSELLDAVLLIRRANIQRRTKRIQWITELEKIAPPLRHAYPEDELQIGMEEAYAKLDEFYEECRSRGVLP